MADNKMEKGEWWLIRKNFRLFLYGLALLTLSIVLILTAQAAFALAGGAVYLIAAFVFLKVIYNASEKVRGLWEGMKDVYQWGFYGFYAALSIHTLIIAVIVLTGGVKGEGWLGLMIVEFPVTILWSLISDYLGINILPSSAGPSFWPLVYVYGIIAWGAPGFIIGAVMCLINRGCL